MVESSYLSVIRVWAAMAWADGVLAEVESEALRRLIDRAPMLNEEDRRAALGFLARPVELELHSLGRLARDARAGIYRSAVHLAALDRHIAEAERRLLERLRAGLGLSQAEAVAIEGSLRLGA